MAEVQQPLSSGWAALPADVWGHLARATLRAEGYDVLAWKRLRGVSRIWRASLEGECWRQNRRMAGRFPVATIDQPAVVLGFCPVQAALFLCRLQRSARLMLSARTRTVVQECRYR